MIDREKVINELVSHIENALSVDSDYVDCIPTDLLQYAVALLKAQGTRILTLDEIEDALDTVVWIDRPQIMNSSSEFALVMGYSHKHENTDLYFINGEITRWRYSDYGKTWRCWSSRPTDEQREAVKWDE